MSAPDGRSTWNLIGPGGVHQVVHHAPRYVADDLLTLKIAAMAGTGICWMPDYMCYDEIRARRLVRVLPDWAPLPAIVHAVFPSRRGLSPRCAGFWTTWARRCRAAAAKSPGRRWTVWTAPTSEWCGGDPGNGKARRGGLCGHLGPPGLRQ